MTIQQRLDAGNDLDRAVDRWRRLAVELATMNIESCAAVEKLPEQIAPPVQATDHWKELFRELSGPLPKDSQLKEARRSAYDKKTKQYNQMRKQSIVIDRKQLIKLLKLSKVS